MTFTGQLGTPNSAPGNLALGTLPPSGGGTGGTPPTGSATGASPSGSATGASPSGSATNLRPS